MVGDSRDTHTIQAALRRLPADAYGQVILEVATSLQVRRLDVPDGVSITWLCRDLRQGVSGPAPARGVLAARAARAWISEWMPEEEARDVPLLLWIGCSANAHVDGLYWQLRTLLPHLHLHHPHYDDVASEHAGEH